MSQKGYIYIAFAFVAMAVVNCAKTQIYDSLFESSYTDQCQGAVGDFRVVLQKNSDGQTFELLIEVLDVSQPGALLHIAIANSNMQYKDIALDTTITRGQVIDGGAFSRDEIYFYPNVVMVPYTGTNDPNFLANSSANAITCQINTTDSLSGESL